MSSTRVVDLGNVRRSHPGMTIWNPAGVRSRLDMLGSELGTITQPAVGKPAVQFATVSVIQREFRSHLGLLALVAFRSQRPDPRMK